MELSVLITLSEEEVTSLARLALLVFGLIFAAALVIRPALRLLRDWVVDPRLGLKESRPADGRNLVKVKLWAPEKNVEHLRRLARELRRNGGEAPPKSAEPKPPDGDG